MDNVWTIYAFFRYNIDLGFRKKADYFGLYSDPNDVVDTIDEIWDILNASPNHDPASNRRTLSEINFPTNYANGEKLSAFDRKMSSDYVHFRVGPARLFQFRSNCSNFKNSWDEVKNETIADWELESPILAPWFYNNETTYPGDWFPRTKVINGYTNCILMVYSSGAMGILKNVAMKQKWERIWKARK